MSIVPHEGSGGAARDDRFVRDDAKVVRHGQIVAEPVRRLPGALGDLDLGQVDLVEQVQAEGVLDGLLLERGTYQ